MNKVAFMNKEDDNLLNKNHENRWQKKCYATLI